MAKAILKSSKMILKLYQPKRNVTHCSAVILQILCHLFCEVCTDIKWIKTIGKEIEEEKRNFSFKDFLCNFVSIKVLCFQLSRKCIDQHQCSDQAIFLTSLIALLLGLGRKNTHKRTQWVEIISEEACLFWYFVKENSNYGWENLLEA